VQSTSRTFSGTSFFGFLLQNTKEGYLADPIHGGNKNLWSWKMIGFPGARADFIDWVDEHGARYPLSPSGLRAERADGDADIKKPPVDAVLVGFGWTGAIMGMELTQAGLQVVALERGENRDTYPDFGLSAHRRRADIRHTPQAVSESGACKR